MSRIQVDWRVVDTDEEVLGSDDNVQIENYNMASCAVTSIRSEMTTFSQHLNQLLTTNHWEEQS